MTSKIKRWIFDVEVFPNLFTCVLIDYDTDERVMFEISERKNERDHLVKFFKQENTRFIGYNNKHYDDAIIMYIMHWPNVTNDDLYRFSMSIINSDEPPPNKYKYATFLSADLMSLAYSKMHRVSLKHTQITIDWHNIMESPFPFDQPIATEDIEKVYEYNINDVESTKALAKRLKDDLNIRIKIFRDYNMECMSKDSVRVGVDLLLKLYSRKTNVPESVLKSMRTEREKIDFSECISDKVQFSSDQFNEALTLMKSIKVKDTRKSYEGTVFFGGVLHRFGTGGIHSDDPPGIIIPKEGQILRDADVTSLYPSLMIEYGFYPEHLGRVFIDLYREIRDKRVEAKNAKDKITSDTLKLSLNGTYGNLINPYSWLYDPKAAMSVTLNGQLFMAMLSERLTLAGIQVISLNTDGVTVLMNTSEVQKYDEVCEKWMQETGLNLEFSDYEKIIRKDVNNYIAVYTDGDIKLKGSFDYTVYLGKGYDKPIVPRALVNYFVNNVAISTTIRHLNISILNFCMTQNVGKKFEVEYNGERIQRTNRYYASKAGAYLYKVQNKSDGTVRRIHMLRESPVLLLNKFDTVDVTEYDIDYSYYERQCYDVIKLIQPEQLNLFG